MSDPRANTVRAYLNVLEAALPEAMLLENVKGFTATRKHVTHKYEALDVLRSALSRINRRYGTNYEPFPLVIDAADYGVPQHRQRVFVFAARDGSQLVPPKPERGPVAIASDKRRGAVRFASAWDALWDLDDPDFDPALLPAGSWADLLPSIPEGRNYLHHTARGDGEPLFGWRRRYWSFLLKLAKGRPSWTLQAQAGPATGPFHWRSRQLSHREIARLQCFPDDWSVRGAPSSVRRQLGNAVPPPVGELLGLEIRRQIFGQNPGRAAPLVPEVRSDCPEPEQVAPVPDRLLALRGQQADHPGPGLGPGVSSRTEGSVRRAQLPGKAIVAER